MDFRNEIVKALEKAGLDAKISSELLEVPQQKENGDFALPCFRLAKEMRKNPFEIAKGLAEKITLPKGFRKVEAKGPYLNFYLDEQTAGMEIIGKILKEKNRFGLKKQAGEKIIVEYCQANPLKDFHIGHVRNICLGESIARLFEASGRKVYRMDYGGDVGPHVSKTLYAYQNLWKGKEPKEIHEKGKWLGMLYSSGAKEVKGNEALEQKMRDMVVRLEKGDKKLKGDWKKLRKKSLDYFKQIFKELGVKFDRIVLESEVEKEGIKIAQKLLEQKFAVKDEGAVLVDLEEHGLGKFLILKSDGAALYSSKDIALAKMKKQDLKASETCIVVGSEQKFYFQQLVKTIELLNARQKEYCFITPVHYELVMLKEGKMSSREGNIISYADLHEIVLEKTLKETRERHKEWKGKKIRETAEKLCLAAIKFGMVAQDKNKEIRFDWEKATSLEGESGPFILYSIARAKNILRKAGKFSMPAKFSAATEKEKELLSAIAEFEGKIGESINTLSPHKISHYLINLASVFNSFYHEVPVLKAQTAELRNSRLCLVKACQQVLENGLNLLNIEPVEEM